MSRLSLSLRERGLKQQYCCTPCDLIRVALLAGAWIETLLSWTKYLHDMVALLAGAWIETYWQPGGSLGQVVALLAGAWIETLTSYYNIDGGTSLSLRERGLKP